MDHHETIWIKQEETIEVPNVAGTVTGKKAVMDNYETIWIKQEETDEVHNETGTAVQIYPSTLHAKEELEKDLNQEIIEDPLGIPGSSHIIKEGPEVILEVDETDNIVATSTRCESDGTQLIQTTGESCGTSFEETVNEAVVSNELEIGTEKSTHFTVFSTHTQELTKEDSFHDPRLKCTLNEKEFNRFSCSFCLLSFSSKYMLIMHVFVHIDGVEPPTYVCKSCGEVFSTNISLNEHLKINECDKASSSSHNDKTDSICNNENIFLKGDQGISFTKNTENQYSPKESRNVSKKSFNYIHDKHNITHTAEERNIHENCETLSKTGSVTNDTVLHTAKKSHTCDICGKSFTNSSNLKRHALIHSGTRPHKCDVCCKSFTELGTLKTHVLVHIGVRPHKCDVCGKCFTQSSHLKSHSLIHTGETPYKCDVCGMSFTELGNLKRHALTHTGIRPYKCDICGKSFTELGNLKRHVLIHSGMRQHKCNVCDKSFTQLGDLKRHMLTHTGERPYKCDICDKSFSQLSIFKRHELIHTGLRPHKCNICGKSFTRLGQLKTHALIHTSVRPQV